jgi:MFS family permease
MSHTSIKSIQPKISLISAFFVHLFVEIPYFIFPVLILVIGENLNLGDYMWIGIGAVGTTGTLAAGLPAPIFGWLSDKYRRGVMMSFSLILSALGALIIGLFGFSLFPIMVGFGIIGLGVGLYHPPGLSWVSSAFKDQEKETYSRYFNRILGIHGVGGTIGSAVGPISVFFLLDVIDWRQIYVLWSIPLIVLVILFWFTVARFEEPPIKKPKNIKVNGIDIKNQKSTTILNPNVIIIFVFMILMSLTWGMIIFILSPFLSEVKDFPITDAALFIGVSHLFGASGQLVGGVLGDKYSEKVALLFASSLQTITLIGIYLFKPPVILFSLYMILFVVNAIFWPVTNSFLAQNTKNIGSAFGGFMLTVNVVRAVGPSIDGFLITFFPSNYLFIFIFGIIFSSAAFLTLIPIKGEKNLPPQGVGQ